MPAPKSTPEAAVRPPGRGRAFALFLGGVLLSVAAFVLARASLQREVEGRFRAAAQDHAEAVGLGLERGFETVLLLRDYFVASSVPIDGTRSRPSPVPR